MVSTCASEPYDLREVTKLIGEARRHEGRPIVGKEGLGNNSVVMAHQFIIVFGGKSFVSVQVSLEFDVDIARGVIHKQTTTTVHLTVACLASQSEETAFG